MIVTELLARLQSPSMKTRIGATYELDYGDFAHPQIVAAVRENLSLADPDLLDITIMRLMVRGKDVHSLARVWAILETTRDDIVVSSAVLALSNLARSHPETAATTLQKLEALPRSHLATDNVVLLRDALAELRHAQIMSAFHPLRTLGVLDQLKVMEPPWQKHPDIPAGSICWRMGEGDGYYDQFYRWFSRLTPAEQSTFAGTHTPPRGWENLYETIRKHPWRQCPLCTRCGPSWRVRYRPIADIRDCCQLAAMRLNAR